jgi:GDP-4-dehydro-6-deoxy-D-mannose reductase
MKEVLITGSEGFVGQHLWKELESNGYKVFGTSLSLPEEEKAENIHVCDITNTEEINKIIEALRPEAIFHLAAWSNPGSSFNHPQKTLEVNAIGTINLLEAVRRIKGYRPRILIIGSSAEFGIVSTQNLPITENTTLSANSPYGVSKITNWFTASQYFTSYGMDIVYPTPFNHTGPGQGLGFLATDISSQIADIENGKQEPVIKTGDLSALRDMLDVRDVVRAYRLLLEKGQAGERYLICTGNSVPVKEIVEKLISFSSKEVKTELDQDKLRPSDMPEQRGDPSKIKEATGWEPEIPLDKTLKDLLDWYREKR